MIEALDRVELSVKEAVRGPLGWRLQADLDELRRKIETAERQKADRSKAQVGLGVDG